jgi:hypothetical protein
MWRPHVGVFCAARYTEKCSGNVRRRMGSPENVHPPCTMTARMILGCAWPASGHLVAGFEQTSIAVLVVHGLRLVEYIVCAQESESSQCFALSSIVVSRFESTWPSVLHISLDGLSSVGPVTVRATHRRQGKASSIFSSPRTDPLTSQHFLLPPHPSSGGPPPWRKC